MDLTDVMVGRTGTWLARLYPWLVQRPALYEGVYRMFLHARQERGGRIALPARAAERGLRAVCESWRPDAVVTTFHVAAQALGRLRARGDLSAPLVTYVTTFGVHDGWLHPATDAYFCISPVVGAAIADRSATPVHCPGPLVRPPFDPRGDAGPVPPVATTVPRTALLVAGSLGMGDVEHTARVLLGAGGWRPVVVCGTNEALRSRLRSAGVADALGWVDDMAALMRTADVLVDNAAGLTAKEALGLGIPVVVFRPIAGHGRHDAAAMAALGVTEIVERDEYLVPVLDRVVAPGPLRRDRTRRGRELFRDDPAEVLVNLLSPRRPQLSIAAGR